MIIEIEKLKKIDDIITCEGSILSMYKYIDNLYLSSHLSDGTGMVFYSTNRETLLSYLNSNITLFELYQLSKDFIVTRKFQKETSLFLSIEFQEQIQYGKYYINTIKKEMINFEFIERIYNGTLL